MKMLKKQKNKTWKELTKNMSLEEKQKFMVEKDLVELGNGQIVGRTGAFVE